MKPPLIPIHEDHKWKLLSEILNIFELRSTRQILAQYEILPLEKSRTYAVELKTTSGSELTV